jgi:hypothetical protein
VAQGELTADAALKTVHFDRSVQAKFLRLVALSSYEKHEYVSLAELEVIPEK